MSFLETVFRRILIRNADKAITGTAKAVFNSVGNQSYSAKAKLPTVGNLVWNVISFALIVFLFASILLAFGTKFAYVAPFLLIWRIVRPLAYNYTYDYKSVSITKADRRYKTGSRTVGYRYVKDKEVRIDYNESQIRISKIEGFIKLAILIACLVYIYKTTSTLKFELENMSYSEKINLLTPGDTLFTNSPEIYYYAKYKDEFRGTRIEHSGNDSVSIAGIYIRTDSATDKYAKKYTKYFEVTPLKEPKYYDPILFHEKDRVTKNWFVEPSDVNIGEFKGKKYVGQK